MIGLGLSIGWKSNKKTSGGEVPVNTVAPVVSGTNTVGSVLTTTNGTWSGSLPITYTYQWLRDGSNIGGANLSTYTLVSADSSNLVSCRVTATNALGSANAISNSLTIYEPEYKAVLDKAILEGFTLPIDEEKIKQNNLMISLKSSGGYTKADQILVLANTSNANFTRVDWKNPTRLATLVNAPAFVSGKGLQGGGTSYIDTNFNPTVGTNKYTQNNASRYVFMDTASGTGVFDGCATTDRNLIQRNNLSNQRINSNVALTGGAVNYSASRGMKSIHRTSSLNVELFNDTTQDSRTALSATMASSNQTILRSGSTSPIYGAHTISFYMMGESMVSENSAIVTAVNAYLNSL
jgi:hypothetical protein